MSYLNTYQPNAASMQAVGMSTSFNAQGAVETSKTGEYVPFKVKYDLGKYLFISIFFSGLHYF